MCSSSVSLELNKADVAIARKTRESGVKTNFVIDWDLLQVAIKRLFMLNYSNTNILNKIGNQHYFS